MPPLGVIGARRKTDRRKYPALAHQTVTEAIKLNPSTNDADICHFGVRWQSVAPTPLSECSPGRGAKRTKAFHPEDPQDVSVIFGCGDDATQRSSRAERRWKGGRSAVEGSGANSTARPAIAAPISVSMFRNFKIPIPDYQRLTKHVIGSAVESRAERDRLPKAARRGRPAGRIKPHTFAERLRLRHIHTHHCAEGRSRSLPGPKTRAQLLKLHENPLKIRRLSVVHGRHEKHGSGKQASVFSRASVDKIRTPSFRC
jgi:hypothetical protein